MEPGKDAKANLFTIGKTLGDRQSRVFVELLDFVQHGVGWETRVMVMNPRRLHATISAKQLLFQAISLPSRLGKTVVEVIGNIGARFCPRLFVQIVDVELIRGDAVDISLGVDVNSFTGGGGGGGAAVVIIIVCICPGNGFLGLFLWRRRNARTSK